jgi:hypothetical protein
MTRRFALALLALCSACGGPEPRGRGDGGGGTCTPEQLYCTGDDVYRCNADGTDVVYQYNRTEDHTSELQ